MGKLREIGLRTRLAVGLALLACALGVPATAAAAPPNDAFAGATPIPSLPYTNTVSSVETATFESGDPYLYCRRGQVAGDNSVWYRYTTGPGVERLKLTTDSATTNYDSVIQVFAGSRNGADMALGGCADDPSSSTGGDTA